MVGSTASRWTSADPERSSGTSIDMVVADPEKNFEALWKTFHERYPFFELRGVDWTKQYGTYRPIVTAKTNDDELFCLLCRMAHRRRDLCAGLPVHPLHCRRSRALSLARTQRRAPDAPNEQDERHPEAVDLDDHGPVPAGARWHATTGEWPDLNRDASLRLRMPDGGSRATAVR